MSSAVPKTRRLTPSEAIMLLCVLERRGPGDNSYMPVGRWSDSVWHRHEGAALQLIGKLESRALIVVTRHPITKADDGFTLVYPVVPLEAKPARDFSAEEVAELRQVARASVYWRPYHWGGLSGGRAAKPISRSMCRLR